MKALALLFVITLPLSSERCWVSVPRVLLVETHVYRAQKLGFKGATHQIRRHISLQRRSINGNWITYQRISVDEFPLLERHGKMTRLSVVEERSRCFFERNIESGDVWEVMQNEYKEPE